MLKKIFYIFYQGPFVPRTYTLKILRNKLFTTN